jgi:hypothetical protein
MTLSRERRDAWVYEQDHYHARRARLRARPLHQPQAGEHLWTIQINGRPGAYTLTVTAKDASGGSEVVRSGPLLVK